MSNAEQLLLATAAALWPDVPSSLTHRPAARSAPVSDYLVVPRTTTARWLLPAASPNAVSTVLADRLGPAGRLAPTLRHLPWPRLRLATPDATAGLLHRLAQAVPTRDVAWAVRLGAWAQARSVVLRGLAPDGSTVAYAKVGIDEHGRRAVRTEASALATVRAHALRWTTVPEVLDQGQSGGLEYVVVSPLETPRRRDTTMPVTAMLELARATGDRAERLTGGRWFARVRQDVASITDPITSASLRTGLDALAEHACDTSVPVGPWHGDWTPWNMGAPSAEDPRVPLWDWEHFDPEVPIGFDLLHHRAQELRTLSGTDRRQEDEWSADVRQLLGAHVGLAPDVADAVGLAYLVEVNARFTLDRQGSAEQHRRRSGWGPSMVERTAVALRDRTNRQK